MDPTLRNPLLRLLQEQYRYRDGDFDRNPVTGLWIDSEDPENWETRLNGGRTMANRAINNVRTLEATGSAS